jgi:endonuclease/exonuclease/phosphatase family metal-dependent hydrolase
VRLATFNLLSGRSLTDGGIRAADLTAAAAELDADVVGLQEVDRAQDRSAGVDQTALVADALGAGWSRFVPALDGTPGAAWSASRTDDGAASLGPSYGVGLVSRLPVLSWRVRRFGPAPFGMPLYVPGNRGLTHVPDEPRLALAAVVEGPAGPFTVLTAHLSFVPGWNVRQLRAVVRWAASLPGPRLLVGDFNLPGAVPRLVSGWTQLARVPTYPSWQPRVQLDHALADRPVTVGDATARRLAVSDHCALVVDVDLS